MSNPYDAVIFRQFMKVAVTTIHAMPNPRPLNELEIRRICDRRDIASYDRILSIVRTNVNNMPLKRLMDLTAAAAGLPGTSKRTLAGFQAEKVSQASSFIPTDDQPTTEADRVREELVLRATALIESGVATFPFTQTSCNELAKAGHFENHAKISRLYRDAGGKALTQLNESVERCMARAVPGSPASLGKISKSKRVRSPRQASVEQRLALLNEAGDLVEKLQLSLPLGRKQLFALAKDNGFRSYETVRRHFLGFDSPFEEFNKGLAEVMAERGALRDVQYADDQTQAPVQLQTKSGFIGDESLLEASEPEVVTLPSPFISSPTRDRILWHVFELMGRRGGRTGLPTSTEYSRWAAQGDVPKIGNLKREFKDAGPGNGWNNFLGLLAERTGLPLPEPKGQVIDFAPSQPFVYKSLGFSMA